MDKGTQSTGTGGTGDTQLEDNYDGVAPYRPKTEEDPEEQFEPLVRVPTSKNDDELSRMLSRRPTNYTEDLPPMGAGKPYPPALPDRQPYRVEFEGEDDPLSPVNWTTKKKLIVAGCCAFGTSNVAFTSAIYAGATGVIEEKFHVGVTVSALGTSLYVLGFATGPCVWGPISEYLGRGAPLLLSNFLIMCFCFASATAKDFQTLILSRFFAGCCGSAPLSVVPSIFVDIFASTSRGKALAIFGLCVAGGPMLAPVLSGYITNSYLGWRWNFYITGITSALSLVLCVIGFDETYHPLILAAKARELRERTGNWGIYAQHETVSLNMRQIVENTLSRPMIMLFREPILFLMSLYGGLVYGLLYMCLEAIPLVYEGYGFKGGNILLPYLGLLIGCACSTIVYVLFFEDTYQRALRKVKLPVAPEARLHLMMTSAPVFTIGIFWMFWTGAYPKTAEHPNGCHWMLPTVGGALFGFGFLGIFMAMIMYVIDCYLMLAASGMAANTFLRSAFAAAFPLFTVQMFTNLGLQWAGTLVGCLSIVLLPVPFVFFFHGQKIRRKSKFAMDLTQKMPPQEPKEDKAKPE